MDKNKLKVLMTSETFLPRMGGAEVHCKNIYLNLNKNFDVKFFTLEPGISNIENQFKIQRYSDKSLKDYFNFLKVLNKEVKKSDLVHSHYCYKLAFFAGFFAKLHKKPFVVTLHGFGILDRKGPFLFRIFHDISRKFSLKFADKIISTSEDLAINVPKHTSSKKVVIISNGVDFDKFSKKTYFYEKLKSKYCGKKILLTVRRLNDKNGVHFLVDSLKYLKQLNDDFIYLIIGWGPNEKLIKDKIKEYGLEKNVDFIGRVDNDLIPDYLHISDIVLFPSSAESTSLACVEAMATDNLLVVSKVGGLIELIGKDESRGVFLKMFDWENSNYYPPERLSEHVYEQMADVLNDIILNYNSYQSKIDSSKEYVKEKFDWKYLGEKTGKVYKELINKK